LAVSGAPGFDSHHLHQHHENRRQAVFLLVGSGWEEKPRSGFTKRGAARFGRPKGAATR
jgi:hypothetical protein